MVKKETQASRGKLQRETNRREPSSHPGESAFEGQPEFQNPEVPPCGLPTESDSLSGDETGPSPDDSCWDVFLPDDEIPAEEDLLTDGLWDWDERDRDLDTESGPWPW